MLEGGAMLRSAGRKVIDCKGKGAENRVAATDASAQRIRCSFCRNDAGGSRLSSTPSGWVR